MTQARGLGSSLNLESLQNPDMTSARCWTRIHQLHSKPTSTDGRCVFDTYPVLLAAPVPGCSACDSCPSSCIFHRMSAPPMNSPATYTCAAARGHAGQALASFEAHGACRGGLPSNAVCMNTPAVTEHMATCMRTQLGRGPHWSGRQGEWPAYCCMRLPPRTVLGLVAGAPAARWASC